MYDSSKIYPSALQNANRALTQFITIRYSTIEYLTSLLLFKCLRNPVDEERVRHVVTQSRYTDQLFWSSFTSDEKNAFDTINRIGNSQKINLINEIDDGSLNIPVDRINSFSDERHKIAHHWEANTHVNIFDDIVDRSSIFALVDDSYGIVDELVEKVYSENIKRISDYIRESIEAYRHLRDESLSSEELKALPLIHIIDKYQNNIRVINRNPMAFETIIIKEEHEELEDIITNHYNFDEENAKNINILPSIRKNQPIESPHNIHMTDLEMPTSCEVNSGFQIQTEIGLTDASTDAHGDDDFTWYAILFTNGNITATYPDSPFKNKLELGHVDNEIVEFTHSISDKRRYTIQIGIILEGTMSIQPIRKEKEIKIQDSAED